MEIRPDTYARIKEASLNPNDPAYQSALARTAANGFNFSKEEEQAIQEGYDRFVRTQSSRLGKEGEMALTPAGATTVSDLYRKAWQHNFTPEERQFWEGAIPQGLADAVEESGSQYSLLTEHLKKLEREGKDPSRSALAHVLNGWQGFHRMLKQGATLLWPAYWMRNLQGSQIQGLEQASLLGSQFNVSNLLRTHKVLNGADLVMRNGKVIPNATIMALMRQNGVSPRYTSVTDILGSMGDYLNFNNISPSFQRSMPELGAAVREGENLGFPLQQLSKGTEKIANLAGVPMTDRFWRSIPNFFGRVEAFGREHLFMNLLEQGFDPMSAGQEVNRLLIDYAHGKTKFERQILNNAFFFYSFSRGNATNNFMAMLRKPGALSTQLALHKEIAEMMTDPKNYVDSPDIEEAIRTSRNQESLQTYLGTNPKTGLPQVLTGTGLPVEDISKFATISLPQKLTPLEVINAVGDTASRTAQLAFSQVNPAIRGVVEHFIAGKNLYFNRPIDDPSLRRVANWEASTNTVLHYPFGALPKEVWTTLDNGMKTVLGGKDNGDGTMTINPYAMTVLSYFVPAASRFISTRKALTAPGIDPDVKYLRLLTGVHIDEVDPQKTVLYDKLERARRQLRAQGLAETKSELGRRRAFDLSQDDETTDEE
jgi:hypothetical protein